MKFEIIENAKRQVRMCFLGIAIPTEVKNIDGEMVQVEKVLKFNRKALRNMGKRKIEKADPRLVGGEDRMILKVGKPGSNERKSALAEQYAAIMASGEEVSPFAEGGHLFTAINICHKCLSSKYLQQILPDKIDVSLYLPITYDELAKTVPNHIENRKNCVKKS